MKPAEERKYEDTTDQRFLTNPTEYRKTKETIDQCIFFTYITEERKDKDTKIQIKISTNHE